MNKAAFFQAADDFKVPAGNGLDPLFKETSAVAVTQGAGPNNARALHRIALHGAVKTTKDLERLSHCLGIKVAIAKHTFTQAGDFAVLMQGYKATAPKFGDAEPH